MRESSQFPRFSQGEMAGRHASARKLMEQNNVHALLVYGAGRYASEVFWLTDW
ncbi:MAG: hypothetical protein HYY47_06855, partial [Deltaproteobacteria bacterium]|nr:hypothetical protein [Deltaproteobacteria bacterium]